MKSLYRALIASAFVVVVFGSQTYIPLHDEVMKDTYKHERFLLGPTKYAEDIISQLTTNMDSMRGMICAQVLHDTRRILNVMGSVRQGFMMWRLYDDANGKEVVEATVSNVDVIEAYNWAAAWPAFEAYNLGEYESDSEPKSNEELIALILEEQRFLGPIRGFIEKLSAREIVPNFTSAFFAWYEARLALKTCLLDTCRKAMSNVGDKVKAQRGENWVPATIVKVDLNADLLYTVKFDDGSEISLKCSGQETTRANVRSDQKTSPPRPPAPR